MKHVVPPENFEKALRRARIESLAEFKQMTFYQLYARPGCGRRTVAPIVDTLKAMGMSLADNALDEEIEHIQLQQIQPYEWEKAY